MAKFWKIIVHVIFYSTFVMINMPGAEESYLIFRQNIARTGIVDTDKNFNGTLKWKSKQFFGWTTSTQAFFGDLIYFGTINREIVALKIQNGEQVKKNP